MDLIDSTNFYLRFHPKFFSLGLFLQLLVLLQAPVVHPAVWFGSVVAGWDVF